MPSPTLRSVTLAVFLVTSCATAAPKEDRIDRWIRESAPPPREVRVYVDKLVAIAQAAGLELVPDSALDLGARLYARHSADAYPGYRNDLVVTDSLFERAGSPAHHIWRYAIGPVLVDDVQGMEPYPVAMLMKKHATTRRVAFGVGFAPGPPSYVAFAFSNIEATLDRPLPTRAKVGDRLVVKGRLASGFDFPSLAWEVPGVGVERRVLGNGPLFETELVVDRPGTWRVEVVGRGKFGPTPVLNATVLVEVEPEPPVAPRLPYVGNAADAEATLLRRLDVLRSNTGRTPLIPDERLSKIGRAHCHDIFRNHFVGHVSPTTGGPGDRVRRARYPATAVGENLATSKGPEDAQTLLERSPGHLSSMLEPSFTRVGVAAVPNPEAEGVPWCFIELFAATNDPAPTAPPPTVVAPTPRVEITEPPVVPGAALELRFKQLGEVFEPLSVGLKWERTDDLHVRATIADTYERTVSLANLDARCAPSEAACKKELAFLGEAMKSAAERWALDADPLLILRERVPKPEGDQPKVVALPLMGDVMVTYWQRGFLGFVTEATLEAFGFTAQRVHNLASEGARRRALSLRVRFDAASGSAAVSNDDGESSVLLLLEDRVFPLLPFKPTRACVPSRHVLLLADGTKDASFDALCRIVHDEEAYPLSPLVFRRGDFGWTR